MEWLLKKNCSFFTKASEMFKAWKLLVLFHFILFRFFEKSGSVSDNPLNLKSGCLKPIKYVSQKIIS